MVSFENPAETLGEQDVWRSVHAAAAAAGLDAAGIQALRSWTGYRMRDLSFAVFEGAASRNVRPSFLEAIKHAAADIAAGKVPG